MNGESWDGQDLLSAMLHAARVLGAHQEEVNALNVFPVPDGDTGSNMLATVQAAIAEAELIPVADRNVPNVAAAMRLGALMGARGNSGVILSQIFRGMSEVVTSVERVTGADLGRAFDRGCGAAFAAVAQPVEGTILTVARDVSRAAEPIVRERGNIERVLTVAVAAAAASVERSPQLLPVLAHAGVVDAGGRGLELLLRGALEFERGEELPEPAPLDVVLPSLDAIEADGFGYETVFLVTPHSGTLLDTVAISSRLSQLGASVLVAGDERAVKIHVHNDRPDEIIAYGLSLGGLSRIAVENLDRQARGVRDRVQEAAATVSPRSTAAVGALPDGPQVIAVVSGDGLARIFRTLGARAVVLGGQSANPSAGELADAITASGASEVIVLPNNPNVRMAARQAADLCPSVRVEVVPTRNAAEGIAAILALDTSDDARTAADKMTAAAGRIQSMQVAVAVRNARVGRRRVKHGDFIVLGPSDGLLATGSDRTAAVVAAARRLKPGYELMTVYRGQNVPQPDAEHLGEALRAELDGVEIELVDGGQPHYDFLISAE